VAYFSARSHEADARLADVTGNTVPVCASKQLMLINVNCNYSAAIGMVR
jgi:hypothetical protein